MSSAIDFRTLPINIPSLCIPRVFSNIDEKRIRRIFDELNMGDIERVDIVNVQGEKGEKFNRVFIHFKRWLKNTTADMARDKLLNGKEIKIIYDEPWFWKVSAYRELRATESKPRAQEKKKATIQFDDDDDDESFVEKKPFARSFSQRPQEGIKEELIKDQRPNQRPNNQRPRQEERPRQENQRPRQENQRPRQENQRPNNQRPNNQRPNQRPNDQISLIPVPELKRHVAETFVPKSPSSSPPRRLSEDREILET